MTKDKYNMKKLTPFLISCLLVFGAAACQNPAKTSADAPDNTKDVVATTPDQASTDAAKNDAQSETRRNQLNADIRAREQRNNTTGGDTKRAKGDLESEVRSKLEANIPNGNLAVSAIDDGTVTVTGTVPVADQIKKIEPLSKEIKGVTKVVNKATVAKPN
jgi:hyperosmotically inducible periplasmic protein